MVSFRSLAISAVAAFAIPSLAVTSPQDVTDNINALTQKSQSLIQPASSLTLLNGPLVVAGQGPLPKIILGFGDIVTTATKAFAQMQGMPPVGPGADSDMIFDAFREFVRIHQMLLKTLIGKAGLFTTVPFVGAPVAAVLRQIEKVVDTLAFTLIDTLQGRSAEVKSQGDMLDATIEQGIKAFGGLSVPDLLSSLTNPMMSSMPAQPAQSMMPVQGMMSSIISNMMPEASGNPMMQSMLSSMMTGMPGMMPAAATPTAMSSSMPSAGMSMPTSAASAPFSMNNATAPSGSSPMMSGASPSGASPSMMTGSSPSGMSPSMMTGTSPSGASPSGASSTSGLPVVMPSTPSSGPNAGNMMMPLGSMPMDGSAFIIEATGENIVCSCSNRPSSRVKRAAVLAL